MKNINKLLVTLAIVLGVSSVAHAVNKLSLKPDGANNAVCTVFGSPNNGMSCGKITAPASGKILDVVGDLAVTGNITATGSVSGGSGITASSAGGTGADLSAATQGAIPQFHTTGVMSAVGPGTSGQVLKSNGAGADVSWASQSTLSVGSATNLASGVAGAVPYQTGAGATGFTAAGGQNNILQSNGTSVPTWTSTPIVSTQAMVFNVLVSTQTAGAAGAAVTATCLGSRTAIAGGCNCTSIVGATAILNYPSLNGSAMAGGATTAPNGWTCQVVGGTGGQCAAFASCASIQ